MRAVARSSASALVDQPWAALLLVVGVAAGAYAAIFLLFTGIAPIRFLATVQVVDSVDDPDR